MEVAFTTMQSAGRSSTVDTGRHAFGGPSDWRGRWKWSSNLHRRRGRNWEAPDTGRTECFLFLVLFSLADWGEGD